MINSAKKTGYSPDKESRGGEPEHEKSDNRTAYNSQNYRKHNHITKEFEQKHISSFLSKIQNRIQKTKQAAFFHSVSDYLLST